MNCAFHSDRPSSAFCQNCGKALCESCVRQISGHVYCEDCLAQKLGMKKGTASAAAPSGVPNPGLATLLGFIPGVGAMYNGQYVKAIVHVLVFVILIGMSSSHGLFGILIAAWVVYQVFDAHHTARARKYGLPVPDPFGLNELGNRIGVHNAAPYVPPATGPIPGSEVPYTPPAYESYPPAGTPTATGTGPATGPGSTVPPYGYQPYTAPYDPNTPPMPPPDIRVARREPIGAIVLIGLGMLFLFDTLGIFHFHWIGHGWPIIIIVIGVWLVVSRSRRQRSGDLP